MEQNLFQLLSLSLSHKDPNTLVFRVLHHPSVYKMGFNRISVREASGCLNTDLRMMIVTN